jgi:succinylglutamate desuccinylase
MEGEFRPMRERFSQMPPEERQRFQRNAERWLRMNPEERKMLREHETMRRERIKHEVEDALRASGLTLDAGKRDQFQNRYTEERRKIEQTLHREIEDKRQQQLAPMIERLKKEFESQQTPAPSTATTPTASPK